MGKISFTMDMWSEPNLVPFMAVTVHWIERSYEETVGGEKLVLKLQANLIGFQRVPGCHDGEHLAHAFIYVTDCLKITENVFPSTFYLNLTVLTYF